MSSGPPPDLRIPRSAAGLHLLVFTVFATAASMVAIVAAVDGHWTVLIAAGALLTLAFVAVSTAGYRLRAVGGAQIEVHSLTRVRKLNLASGFDVREGRFGLQTLRVRAGSRTVRVLGAVGGSILVREWLHVAANQ
ncbi:MAG: hypothetical protein Q8K63_08025 [Acidimicrobiales bacterium]|nr:hypothetical protein [Acidimicrobiales bacterium]